MAEFKWDANRRLAAQLIADGELRDPKIAERVGVARSTVWEWRQVPEFKAAVERAVADNLAALSGRRISRGAERIDTLNDMWVRMLGIVRERGESPDMAAVPGGTTGLLCRNVKGVGKGDDFQLIELFEFDAALSREMRETAKQAAIELGQWNETKEGEGLASLHTVMKAKLAERRRNRGHPGGLLGGPEPA